MHIQTYTCEDGAIAKFIIPEDATENDLKGIKEMLAVIMSRKFKMNKSVIGNDLADRSV